MMVIVLIPHIRYTTIFAFDVRNIDQQNGRLFKFVYSLNVTRGPWGKHSDVLKQEQNLNLTVIKLKKKTRLSPIFFELVMKSLYIFYWITRKSYPV